MQIVQLYSEVRFWVYVRVMGFFFKLKATMYFKANYQLIFFLRVCEGYFA